MGLSWQQGPLAGVSVGRFLTDVPLPARLLYAEPARRRLRVRFSDDWIADSEDVVLLHEPGRYPVAYFAISDVRPEALEPTERITVHRDLGPTAWYTVRGHREAQRAAWAHTHLPEHATLLRDRVAFAWRAMDAFYDEDERIVGHAPDNYHRIDIRRSSRHLMVRAGTGVIADTTTPVVLYESGFAPRWYVQRGDVDGTALNPSRTTTFCPYKGSAAYYDIAGRSDAAWYYRDPFSEAAGIDDLVSFDPEKLEVFLDDRRLLPQPGQHVVAHGGDRNLQVGG